MAKHILSNVDGFVKRGREHLKKGSAEYRARITEVFERDNYTCQYTGKQYAPDNHALHPHHRVFKSQGGDDQLDNIVACDWEPHSGNNHANLKGKKLLLEPDDGKINELTKRYKGKLK